MNIKTEKSRKLATIITNLFSQKLQIPDVTHSFKTDSYIENRIEYVQILSDIISDNCNTFTHTVKIGSSGLEIVSSLYFDNNNMQIVISCLDCYCAYSVYYSKRLCSYDKVEKCIISLLKKTVTVLPEWDTRFKTDAILVLSAALSNYKQYKREVKK